MSWVLWPDPWSLVLCGYRTKHTDLAWWIKNIVDFQISWNRVSEDQLKQGPVCPGDPMSSTPGQWEQPLLYRTEKTRHAVKSGIDFQEDLGISRGPSTPVPCQPGVQRLRAAWGRDSPFTMRAPSARPRLITFTSRAGTFKNLPFIQLWNWIAPIPYLTIARMYLISELDKGHSFVRKHQWLDCVYSKAEKCLHILNKSSFSLFLLHGSLSYSEESSCIFSSNIDSA